MLIILHAELILFYFWAYKFKNIMGLPFGGLIISLYLRKQNMVERCRMYEV